VLGRARAGSTGPSAPLLLIGFWPDGSEAEVHDREALVVAHDLDSLSDDRLQTVFDEARTPPDPARPTSFFDDRRGRQRG
jgi:hypothetical protein